MHSQPEDGIIAQHIYARANIPHNRQGIARWSGKMHPSPAAQRLFTHLTVPSLPHHPKSLALFATN